jgi:hydroxymethylbilane synthase
MRPVVYATRRSRLALAQCRAFVEALRQKEPSLEARELPIVTSGDRIQDRPLAEVGGKGLFVKEIEEALLDGRADFAVHSIKDVPGTLPSGLILACVPPREDPLDVLVSPRFQTLDALPSGCTVGTSSLRRAVTISRLRPDLRVVPIRGNVDTRLGKVDSGALDGIVIAHAGLIRLGLQARATQVFSAEISLPAAGQGALGIECRSDDVDMRTLLGRLHDSETAICVAAERGVLVALGGDCKTPLGAYAQNTGESLRIRAFVAREPGMDPRTAQRVAAWPDTEEQAHAIGLRLGESLV